MILHGDELGRTQQGNNNTYAQDSALSWIDWANADQSLVEFTAAVARLRKEHPTFRRSRFFDGRPVKRGAGEPLTDIAWLTGDGAEMEPDNWDADLNRFIGVFLNGQGIAGRDPRGERIIDRSFLVYFNANGHTVECTLPAEEYSPAWEIVVDTAGVLANELTQAGATIVIESRSLVVLRAHEPEITETDNTVASSLTVLSGSTADNPATETPDISR